MTIFIRCHPSTLLKGSDKILLIIIPNLNRDICNLSVAGAQQLLCMLDPYFIQTGYHAHAVSLLKFSAQIILIHVKQLCVFRLIEGLVVVNFQIAANLSENIAGSTRHEDSQPAPSKSLCTGWLHVLPGNGKLRRRDCRESGLMRYQV